MATVVVLGAGISGHTAAAFLKRKLGRSHEVVMVSPNSHYQWIPSNIWVGIGQMTIDQVRFRLDKVYKRWGIVYKQARAVSIHPEGDESHEKAYVSISYVSGEKQGQTEQLSYDYLVNATGPKLNFEATEGLGPKHHTVSICSYDHAAQAWKKLQESLDRMTSGFRQTFLIGTGHALATCQGAAFEYALNVAFEIRKRGLENLADIIWITNEYELGDFGMGGAFVKRGGYITPTKVFAESILSEYRIRWIKRAGVYKVEAGRVHYETLAGEYLTQDFDFAMLIPAFAGAGMTAFDKQGNDITSVLFRPNGFMTVDADYTDKPFEQWKASDWPSTYDHPIYKNIFAAGIAFAPPHAMSKPMKTANGNPLFPSPPRTGMPSGVIGKVIALNIAEKIKYNHPVYRHKASMASMAAACIVSAGYGIKHGKAATMTVSPIVQDWEKYPAWGRDIRATVGEIGLAGHWIKLFLHYMFIHKAKGYPFWYLLPE
ncbi:MAG TPA: FAD/NAD(P)-binding oxidoreductase [Bacteroidales bacterium]|nr:FAD/NAD(P)-binding oxidoreductase [Bacteroidales bacterium]HSA43239.1 FAD/NAD(P)-binding oxidoreductase [Bacteroidales bacterium]